MSRNIFESSRIAPETFWHYWYKCHLQHPEGRLLGSHRGRMQQFNLTRCLGEEQGDTIAILANEKVWMGCMEITTDPSKQPLESLKRIHLRII